MLAIRLQRTGRKGHAQFRFVVQDSHFHPTRGKVVAYLGSYNPHTKTTQLDKERAAKYLADGAQPSDRVANLLKSEGVKLPAWVKLASPKSRAVRNPDKRRSTRPAQAEPKAPVEAAEPETPAEPEQATEAPVEAETSVEPAAEAAPQTAPTEPAED